MNELKIVAVIAGLMALVSCSDTLVQRNIPGPKGDTGDAGAQGPAGTDGLNGADGQGCTVQAITGCPGAPNGGSVVTCSNGSVLIQNGAPGADGQAGAPGTLVTPVQLCQGTTTYPSTFVEEAFCVGGNLYAVYSANDGFLTEIVPGSYSSNAIGSSCGFTVGSNCQITN